MKRKVAKLRLSPNEEARIIREEHERRRKLRIQQVREQQRHIALHVRQAVEQRRQRELELLGEELRLDWERQKREKVETLQKLYQESLQLLGEGHRGAKENEPDLAARAQREEDNHAKAEQRYREALKELKSQRLKDNERQSQSVTARKKALQAEKERSAKVASLPPPPSHPIQQNIDYKKPHVVKKSDVGAFATTHYHMLESAVDREADAHQLNAHKEAELEARRLQDLQREETSRREEQLEKARLRGKQALRREQLIQDRERLLVELEHMQQTDLLRRRQQVSQMPPQIFQPLYKRQETREDFQREMEFAFEDMYTGERRIKGDLVAQLAPEPLPALSTGSQDQELDVTLDEITTPRTENTPHDAEREPACSEQETSSPVEPSQPACRRALKKLLDRIRSQKNQRTEHKSHVPAVDSPTAITDQIPERDTSIETGSLTSEMKNKLTPIKLPERVLSQPALETKEHSTATDTRLPDALTRRIQEFEEERKKREEELEREKQQQVVLLRELEEQKSKLEQMLLEAQQEREHLKAALTQEVTIDQTDLDQDQEVTSVTPGTAAEPEPPAGEDDHTQRIREYQQRLLEQNRIHHRSVEVARQRLEEYQRALRIRYNGSPTSLLPAVIPPDFRQPSLPTPLLLPTIPAVPSYIHAKPQTFMDVPTRESAMPASPPHLPGSSLRAGTKLLPDEVESSLNGFRTQRADVPAWLTDGIMERVTEHLPERPVPEAASDVLVSETIGQTRRRLLASLLAAMEESNGAEEEDGSPQQSLSSSDETDPIAQTGSPAGHAPVSPVFFPGLLPPPARAAKPPVTRVRLGIMEMTEQHELSAIQEVATPVDTSHATGQEYSAKIPSHPVNWDLPEESDSSLASDGTLQTPSVSGSVKRTAERPSSSGSSSRGSSHLIWRERLLMGAGTSPESSESLSGLRRISALSSDSGRGADYSGPAVTSYRSPTESPHGPPDSDCLSSTTISTGSYITTDPEQNLNTDKSPRVRLFEDKGQEILSPSFIKDTSAAGRPGVAVESVFNDSSIQRIIDRYTRELNISLGTVRKTPESESSFVEEPGSLVRAPEARGQDEGSSGRWTLPSDTAVTRTQSSLEREVTVKTNLEPSSCYPPAQAEDSFRPLIGQLTEQSSCLAAGQRYSAMEQLVGQPSAHSSMIGQPAGLRVSVSSDHGGWDSTLSRLMGRISHQPSSDLLSGGRDCCESGLMGQILPEELTTWLDEGQEGSRMRPLVGESDNEQHSGVSGDRTHRDLRVSAEAGLSSSPALSPEALSHGATVPGVSPRPQDQTSLLDLGPERTEGFPGSDSFHPLLAESTHNETVDPSMTFHMLGHTVPNSPGGRQASGEGSVSPPSEIHADLSVESVPSPECLRTEMPASQESVLMSEDTTRTDVELTALGLSNVTLCDDATAADLQQPAGRAAHWNCIFEQPRDFVPFGDLCPKELTTEQGSSLRKDALLTDKILEAASEKGILEQSQITLVSLTDTTLQDLETTATEEECVWEDEHPDEGGQKGQEVEGADSTLSPEEMTEDQDHTHRVMFLEVQWGPSQGLQDVNEQKRRSLLQRSSRRVEVIKAKVALEKNQSESKAEASQPVTRKTKMKSELQPKTNNKSEKGEAEQPGFFQQKCQLPPPQSDFRQRNMDESKIYTPEQRKREVSVMYKRTRRLYEQLEEVKHQKSIRSRQEACAENRLKAKEFHKKTLQKLRAKQK
ncbi:putative centrosomal protein KIAA1731 -like [Scophthalmus maximus]|uniref:Putative centrosomal protein KIAA1731-like n=1 Tax=Scophthalmus maximus TaxID=52904 RepID=A0A2U9B485_SCOMX|nr:putative centrosomal protein KIAA1731 -like [Scophthalmus maximus]